MSEEEKQAIRNLENLSEFGLSATLNQTDLDKMKIVLNLIEKQQKEIERFNNELDLDYVDNNYVSKDKIRELRDIDNIDLIQYKLKKLLEE